MTFDVMPEVRGVLDEHLDVAQHPALTIRSVYGRYFPWLQHLDHAWVQAATERIFPPDDTRYFRAAWDAYVTFCPAYDAVLPLLRAQYARAVALVGEQDEEANLPYSPKERLAEHLLTYYWRGKIVLDDTLLVDFFRLASDEVRGQAIEFVGRSLEEIPEQIEPAILGRLQKLWEWRLQSAQANMAEHRHELAQFGWWFSSRKFDDTWSLEQLLAILDTTQLVEPDFKVSETLEVLAVRFPLECVRCVTRIAQGDHHDWTIHANREHFEAIIKVALGSNNVEAKAAAARLIEYLVGRGHFEYRRLLT